MRHFFLLLVLALTLTSCSPSAQVQTPAETRLLINPLHNYSVRYPPEYDLAIYSADGVAIIKQSLLNTQDARADLYALPTNGLTTEQAVEEYIASFPGADMPRSPLTIDGIPAIMLDRVPGQEFNRVVFVTFEETLFKLNFTPADPKQADAYKDMQVLYTTVIQSLDFAPGP